DVAPDADSEGKVYRVNPTGNVPKGTIIDLTLYGGQVEMPAPAAPTFQGAPQNVAPNGPLTLMWNGYSCPSGTGAVSAYEFSIQNGTITGGNTFGQNARTAPVVAADAPGQSVVVTYTVTCSGGTGGTRTTGASGELSIPIQAAPAPDPTDGGDE
ncbi:MAG: serine/threonine protein kinase, partial [Microbacterium sp.]